MFGAKVFAEMNIFANQFAKKLFGLTYKNKILCYITNYWPRYIKINIKTENTHIKTNISYIM